MAEFSKREKAIATLLSNFPLLKQKIKYLYKTVNGFIFRKPYSFKTDLKLEKIEFQDFETFFGYYDKSPENFSGDKLIFQATSHSTQKKPTPKKPLLVVLKDLETLETTTFETTAYNWQQGAKIQWIDDKNFIFNDFDTQNNRFISKIVNSNTKKIEKIINFPIYDLFKDTALSLNFSKLSLFSPDYGYKNKKYVEKNDETAIFSVDLKTNQQTPIISFDKIKNTENKPEFTEAKHTVNHIMISPKGDKFIFIHRYYLSKIRKDRLMIADIKGENLQCLNDSGMISHCNWIDNKTIFGYMKFEEKNGFFEIDLTTNKITRILKDKIDKFGDGHPSIFKDKIIFDSYPDRSNMQHLFCLNKKTKKFVHLGEFFHSTKFFAENRCDLHPRIANFGKKVYFDSVFSGKRQLYTIFLEEK